MARLKVLKSIAHNLAHSYLSLMNYIDDEYTVERIFQIAKKTGKTEVLIDVINKRINPDVFNNSSIKTSLIYLEKTLHRLLEAEKLSKDHITSSYIRIGFDLDNIKESKDVPGLELPNYDCISEIIDINGESHLSKVVEWWKY